MVGGGIKKDDGLAAISSTNIFAALEKKRRKSNKKKSDKDNASSKSKDSKGDKKDEEPEQFWAPSQVTVKSWADCDDDDDYYATTAPPPAPWAPDQSTEAASAVKDGGLSQGEESEGEDEGEEEVEDDADEEQHEIESTGGTKEAPPPAKAGLPPVIVSREPERQLSKKELKKKELAELEAVLAELGLSSKEENGTSLPIVDEVEKKVEDNGEPVGEEGESRSGGPVLTESKSTKRRKAKKEKSFKESKDGDIPLTPDADSARTAEEITAEEGDTNGPPADPKEVLKKLASLKKKKSMKESDAAAKAAASEAAARAAKLAAAKKKEKNHYNQQPVR